MARIRYKFCSALIISVVAQIPVWSQEDSYAAKYRCRDFGGKTLFLRSKEIEDQYVKELAGLSSEKHYLEALKYAIELSPQNDDVAIALSRLAVLYDQQHDEPNAYQCVQLIDEIIKSKGMKIMFDDRIADILSKYKDVGQKGNGGKIDKIVADLRNQNKSRESEIAQWKSLQDAAQKKASVGEFDGQYGKYSAFREAAGWAANNLKPAQNIQLEESLFSIAEWDVRRKMPGAEASLFDVQSNTEFNLPDTDILRRKIFLLDAVLKLRENKVDAALELVDKARANLGENLSDRIFAADCDTVQAQVYEYANDTNRAKLVVNKALRVYEAEHVNSIRRADALRCLGRIYREEDELKEAIANFKESIEMAKMAIGEENVALAPYYFDLALTYLREKPMNLKAAKVPIYIASELGAKLLESKSPELKTYQLQAQEVRHNYKVMVAVPGAVNIELKELPP